MVTGSCYVVSGNNNQLMVDFGMFQGKYGEEMNNKLPEVNVSGSTSEQTLNRFSSDEKPLVGVVLTHAHLDHCGRLPMLMQMGFRGEIFMTKATKDLVEISLLDSARINEKEEGQGLYTTEDVLKVFKRFRVRGFSEKFFVGEFEVSFSRVGHILGAASVVVKQKGNEKRVVFSGDVGTDKPPLIRPWVTPRVADVVVMESTYGNRLHSKNEELRIIKEQVDYVYRTGGTLLVPVFSIQRSQRVLYRFHQLYGKEGLPGGMKVYFDSPMAIEVTRVFKKRADEFSDELMTASLNKDPFSFPGLVITEKAWESRKKIGKDKEAKVIVAGSGMMGGGRIMRHAVSYLGDDKNRLLIVGYQAEGTLGRELVEGAEVVEIDEKEVEVKLKIERIKSMSAHADQRQLLLWLSRIKGVKKVILTHGEDEPREELARKIKERFSVDVLEPVLGEEIEI